MAKLKDDVLAMFDPLLRVADIATSPWQHDRYLPDLDLLRELLSLPISMGATQNTGRVANAYDAWIAHELRRAGFPPDVVWPRTRRPRVLPGDLAPLEARLDALDTALTEIEAVGQKVEPPNLRRAIKAVGKGLPGAAEAYVLGDFYSKQVDVAISTWQRGPDVLISTKTMFSSYRKNLINRHEEAVGEVTSLRARHPMAAIGYAYLVRSNIFEEEGAYAILYDILDRLRRPGEAFDATLLLIAEWDQTAQVPQVTHIDQPAEELGAARFFQDITELVCERSPVNEHIEVRRRRAPEPAGGLPDDADEALAPDE
jgi:hypothetical protein